MDRNVFINKRGVFYTLERLQLKSNGLVEVLIGFQSNLYKGETWLKQTLWISSVGVRFRQVSLYILFFQFQFICQHKKAILNIDFQKLDSRMSIFAVYWT